ncbi:MAG: hypothetical protein IPK82_24815 [Polyangiaceae bacterium]|nr:hypothetical protein [Polyangiaceae bacterium]
MRAERVTMARVLLHILERHADEAAFLWERRERACRSPLFDPVSLTEVDRRLQANLEGLVLGGKHGFEKAEQALARGRDPELFTALHVAAEIGDAMNTAKLIHLSHRDEAAQRAAVAALAWLTPQRRAETLSDLSADACPPELHRLAIRTFGAVRRDPGPKLQAAARSPNEGLRAAAFRAAGQLGRRDLLNDLKNAVNSDEGTARSWAVYTAVLFGETALTGALWDLVKDNSSTSVAYCDLAARCDSNDETASRLQALSGSPDTIFAALRGAAAHGDPAHIPWVLPLMNGPGDVARYALFVYTTITGAALDSPIAHRPGTVEPTEAVARRLAHDPLVDLPYPLLDQVSAHWEKVKGSFPSGQRFLGGKPMDSTWLSTCQKSGNQAWRALAAVEICKTSGSGGIYPVHAPPWTVI